MTENRKVWSLAPVLVCLGCLVFGPGCAKSEEPELACPPTGDLSHAAWAGDRAAVASRLEQGAAVNAADERGFTALHWAVIGGHIGLVKLLLDRGADPNAAGPSRMTPLHWAATMGQADAIDALVRRGARVDARDAYGMTPLHEAATPAVVTALSERGGALDAVDERGRTPLHVARNGDVAQRLLELGSDVRIRARDRRTALEVAILDTLESHGLSVYAARAPARLTQSRARFSFLVRDVTPCPLEELVFVVRSPAAWAEVVPLSIDRLAPGQQATITVVLHLRPGRKEAVHPVTVTASLGGRAIGDLPFSVDTRSGSTPEDRGMIRLGKGAIRPTPSRTRYLAFAIVPLLVILGWWLVRRRRGAAGGRAG